MIGRLQKHAVMLVLACVVAGSPMLARQKHESPASSDSSIFSCPAGEEDAMQYFVMRKDLREERFALS